MKVGRFWSVILVGLLWLVLSDCSQAKPQNDLLITSPTNNTIERFDATTGAYLGAFVAAGSGGVDRPAGVDVGPDGNVYVTNATNEILRYDGGTGAFIDVFASGNGLTANNNVRFHGDHMYVGQFATGADGLIKRFDAITGAFVDDFISSTSVDGFEFGTDSVFVSDFFGGVGRYDLNSGAFIEQFITSGEGGLANPTALLLLDNDDLLVSSYSTNSVKRYSSDGTYIDDAITGLFQPEGLAIGPNGNVFAGSYGLGLVNEYDGQDFSFISEFANVGPNTNFFVFRNSAVPEPSTMMPLILGFMAIRLRRHRRDQ